MAELSYPHLRYFWVVAREGNLTRAAKQLRVTQSAVSVQIRKLEDAVGQRLFERRGRGLELTRAGQVALDYAESIFTLGDELLAVLEDVEEKARRNVKVGVLATLSRNFQLGFLRPVLDRDDVTVTVRSGTMQDLVQRLTAHELDVVLSNYVPSREEGATWVVHTLNEQPVGLIGRPPARPERRLDDLLAEVPLVVPSVESGIRAAFDALTARLGVEPRIDAEVDDMAMLRLVARQHRGLSVIPPIVVKDELAAQTLVEHRQLPGIVEPFLALTVPRRLRNPLLEPLLEAFPTPRGSRSDPSLARGDER